MVSKYGFPDLDCLSSVSRQHLLVLSFFVIKEANSVGNSLITKSLLQFVRKNWKKIFDVFVEVKGADTSKSC